MGKRPYVPPPPINKPEKTLRLKYIGESFGVDSLTNGKIYEAWVDSDSGMYRVIDDSEEDYLYDIKNPAPLDGSSPGGIWVDVTDKEK